MFLSYRNLFIFLFLVAAYFSSIRNGFVGAISIEKFLSLTQTEKQALDEFRARVEPLLKDKASYMKHDTYLIRWLRVQIFNIKAAEQMLKQGLRWREENKMDTIHLEDFSDMTAEYHTSVDTHDKIGQPIGVIDIYDWDIRRAVLQGNGRRLLRYSMRNMENLTRQITEKQKRGMNVTQMVMLMNADGANIVQQACVICLPLWIQFVQNIENYYPLYVDEFIIIDGPPAVNVVLRAVRPFLSKETRDIIRSFGQNKKEWMAYLDGKISRNQRTPVYGGTRPPMDVNQT